MPKLNKRHLETLRRNPPERDTVQWDDDLKCFGIRINQAGRIVFIVQYRNAQRRSQRLTIGSYGVYTPAQARDEAEELLRTAARARKGLETDPVVRKREERAAITFKALAEEYMAKAEAGLIILRKGQPKKPGTVTIDKYRMPHLVDFFGNRAVKSITQADCRRCLEGLIAGKHGAPRTYGLLGGVLSYAVGQGYIPANPAHGVSKPADGKRQFRLDADGYRALGKVLEAAEQRSELWQGVGAIWLLALTGARKGEILKLRIGEVDFQGRCLRLGDSKTGESMRALGEPALRLLKALLSRPGRPMSPYVLPGRDPRKPFQDLDGAWRRIVGDGYTAHGLRHAFGSACDHVELSELTIAMLLGHTSARSGSVTRGYISKPDAVLLAAADKVTRYIWQAMTGEAISAEIVELRPAAEVA